MPKTLLLAKPSCGFLQCTGSHTVVLQPRQAQACSKNTTELESQALMHANMSAASDMLLTMRKPIHQLLIHKSQCPLMG